MRRIEVGLGSRSYPILIGEGLLDQAERHLAPFARGGRLVAVTDAEVWSLFGSKLQQGALDIVPLLVPRGEEAKSWEVLTQLVDELLELGIERGDHILALGGGAIGDLAGFAAAILKRGCGFVQVPTTLLAQVDSSVGGKTAINAKAGKNLVGAFHQPAAVLIDPATLDTLPERELRAGYAEVVKYGLIGDAASFEWCEAEGEKLIGGDRAAQLHAIETSIQAKAAIVGRDERETSGERARLNLGHTFGDAVEALRASEGLLHGEAVAIGMVLAFRFSSERGLCSAADAERVEAHLRRVRLPVTLAKAGIADGASLIPPMLHDKKRQDGRLPFVLARGIGQAFLDSSVELSEVEAFLARQS